MCIISIIYISLTKKCKAINLKQNIFFGEEDIMGYQKKRENRKNYGRRREDKCCDVKDLMDLLCAFNSQKDALEYAVFEALEAAKEALCELKEAKEAQCKLEGINEKIECWLNKCGSRIGYNECECDKFEDKLESILCKIGKELDEAATEVCEAIEEINDVKELNEKLDCIFNEYVDCIEEDDCDYDSSSDCGCNYNYESSGCNSCYDDDDDCDC